MELGFLLKKCITFFIEPLGLVLSLLILAVFFSKNQKDRLAQVTLSFGVFLLFLFSYQPFSNLLISTLEDPYPKFVSAKDVAYIHVLGNAHTTDPSQPITSQISDAGLKRVIEGVRIHLLYPQSKLIFTGYSKDTNISNAQMNATLAKALGVDATSIIVDPLAKDTKEEACFAQEIVGQKTLVLVTSATHIARADELFRSEGLEPILAPTDFKKDQTRFLSAPSIDNLSNSQKAIHEYLGILWSKLRS